MRRSKGEFGPPSASPTSPSPTSTASGSTLSRVSTFSRAGSRSVAAAVTAAAAFAWRILHPRVPRPAPSSRNGILGRPGKPASATSTPAASSSGCDRPNTCWRNSSPKRASALARVTISAPEIEIMSAGITVTSPSPMVSTV